MLTQQVTGRNKTLVKVQGENIDIVNGVKLSVSGEDSIAVHVKGTGGKVTNNGNITIAGDDAIGMLVENSSIAINNGVIKGTSTFVNGEYESIVGMEAEYGATVQNDGTIELRGEADGMTAENGSKIINNRDIIINSSSIDSTEIELSDGSTGENNGNIQITGNGIGVDVDDRSTFVNRGTITTTNGTGINGEGVGTTITNETSGIINVSGYGAYGMKVTEGAVINIDVNHITNPSSGNLSAGMKAEYGAIVENRGQILAKDTSIKIAKGATYVIGTNQDGTYGTMKGKDVSIDGNVDTNLVRNNNEISDFTDGYLESVAEIFEKYQNEIAYNQLTEEQKKVLNYIKTTDKESLRQSLKDLTPTLYSNLNRQILEIGNIFKTQGEKTVEDIKDTFNISVIGEHGEIDERNDIDGYKRNSTGFIGAMNLGNDLFGTIGYGYTEM